MSGSYVYKAHDGIRIQPRGIGIRRMPLSSELNPPTRFPTELHKLTILQYTQIERKRQTPFTLPAELHKLTILQYTEIERKRQTPFTSFF
jgi:hypothetical protein